MTTEQQASYWLYHLRDLDVGQWSDPGRCSVFGGRFGFFPSEEENKKPNAAVELKKLGMAAIPQIIAHLDDDRPARCKGHWRRYWPDGHYLLRYGDCCQQIFQAITGKTLYTSGGYPMQEGKGKQCKEIAARWWENYQKRGEKHVLIEETAAGDRDSPEQAQKLAEKHPETALAPIMQGARASKKGPIRASLISVAGKLKDDGVAAFLIEELKGPHLESRVRAAALLAARGDAAGTKALGREWQEVTDQKRDRWNHDWVIDELSHAMIGCGNPALLKLLTQTLSQHEVGTRLQVILQLQQASTNLTQQQPFTAEVISAIEDTLAGLLDDQDETSMSSWGRHGRELHNPPLCDLAARALAARWQQPKLFDIHGPFQVRERQRLGIKNEWLKKRGKDVISVPPVRRLYRAPQEQIGPLLDAMLDANTEFERKKATAAIEKLGLPALPAVRKRLTSLKPDHRAHADLQGLTRRLGLIVAETRFSSDSAQPTDGLRQTMDDLKGKVITEAGFLDLLKGTAASLPGGARGVKIVMERIPDDSGVCLVLSLIADRPPRPGLAPQLSHGSRVVVDKQSFFGGFGVTAGFGGKQVQLADLDWSELTKNLRRALTAPSDVYLFVHAQCSEAR
jgi:hypothetical protein